MKGCCWERCLMLRDCPGSVQARAGPHLPSHPVMPIFQTLSPAIKDDWLHAPLPSEGHFMGAMYCTSPRAQRLLVSLPAASLLQCWTGDLSSSTNQFPRRKKKLILSHPDLLPCWKKRSDCRQSTVTILSLLWDAIKRLWKYCAGGRRELFSAPLSARACLLHKSWPITEGENCWKLTPVTLKEQRHARAADHLWACIQSEHCATHPKLIFCATRMLLAQHRTVCVCVLSPTYVWGEQGAEQENVKGSCVCQPLRARIFIQIKYQCTCRYYARVATPVMV